MYCRNCGAENAQENLYCSRCGARLDGADLPATRAAAAAQHPAAKPSAGISTAGMVIGIVAVVLTSWFFVIFPLAVVGLIMSIVSIRRGYRFAPAGLTLNIIALALSLLIGISWVLAIHWTMESGVLDVLPEIFEDLVSV